MTTGQIIKQLRIEREMSQTELGKVLGVQKSVVAKYEKDAVVNLKQETIKKLSDFFQVSPTYLLGMDVPQTGNGMLGTISLAYGTEITLAVDAMSQLTIEGQRKVYAYALDLLTSDKYKRSDNLETTK